MTDELRNRPRISITLSKELLDKIDELSRRSGKSRSRIIEECLILGIPRWEQLRGQKKSMGKKRAKEERKKQKDLPEEYMRKLLFEDYRWWEWEEAI